MLTIRSDGEIINLAWVRYHKKVGQPIAKVRKTNGGAAKEYRILIKGGAPFIGIPFLSAGAVWEFLNKRGAVLATWKIVEMVEPVPDEYGCYTFLIESDLYDKKCENCGR